MKEAFVLLACMIACQLFFGGSLIARERDDEITIVSENHVEIQEKYIRQIYPEVKNGIEKALGWKLLSQPTVLLVADKEVFQKMSGNPLISAFAVPSKHTIAIDLSSAGFEPYLLHETFEHELCHLILHDHIRERLLPKWLDEGICQWVSGSFGEIVVGKGVGVGGSNFSRHPIALQQLEDNFPRQKDLLIQAYEESRQFVDYLVSHYGKESLLGVLTHLKEGEPIDQAISKSLSKSLENIQEEWFKDLRSRHLWLLWASQYLYEILFVFAALLTVLAFIRSVMRRRHYEGDEEDEE